MKKNQSIWIHITLFVATLITTTIAGTQWAMKDPHEITNWIYGIQYSSLLILFLSAHEFGHYFASKYHKVDATLPFYIPVPIPEIMFFGTFGAIIKTNTPIPSKKALFDIGASGPLAGFIVAIIILIFGFLNLPDKSTIYEFHPEYIHLGGIPNTGLHFGDNLLFEFFKYIFGAPNKWIPPMNEIYHYPFLCVGWFGSFVTALNLIPIGQLDGGHILYAMFGKKQHIIAKIVWYLILFIGLGAFLGIFREILISFGDDPNKIIIFLQNNLLPILNYIEVKMPFIYWGWGGWLFWSLITKLFIKIPHPEIYDKSKIGFVRMVLGILCILILAITLSLNGIYIR